MKSQGGRSVARGQLPVGGKDPICFFMVPTHASGRSRPVFVLLLCVAQMSDAATKFDAAGRTETSGTVSRTSELPIYPMEHPPKHEHKKYIEDFENFMTTPPSR